MVKKRMKLQHRILTIISLLLICVLGFVFIIFNILFQQFTEQTVRKQLRAVAEMAPFDKERPVPGMQGSEPPPPPPENDFLSRKGLPDMRNLPRSMFGHSDNILVDQNYTLLFPSEEVSSWRNLDEAEQITTALKNSSIDLTSADITKIKPSGKEYYLVSIPVENPDMDSNAYFVQFVDMTAIAEFLHQINQVLVITFIIACLLAFISALFLSGLVTKPIQEITAFAEEIGKGHFIQIPNQYQEQETYQLAKRMNETSKELQKLNQEEQFFFQNVSHDLRTPLQVIQCHVEGLEKGIVDKVTAEAVIKTETNRLRDMVNDLLFYSYIDNTSDHLKLQTFDIRELLSLCLEQQSVLMNNKKLQLVCEFSSTEVVCKCDEKRMKKAFTNLISNAIRYAEHRITVRCTSQNKGIQIEIENDGEAIDEGAIPTIFNRFQKGKKGNYGIGLAIVKSIVQQHKGFISVKQVPEGTCFRIFLPA